MGKTKIDWCDRVWNPTTGCTKVSQGCKNCYVERIYKRFHRGNMFSEVRCYPERLEDTRHWRKPQRVFVDSMSDLFHEDVPDEFIDHVFARIEVTKKHTYMILTKRPVRMLDYMIMWSSKHHDPYTPPGSGLYLSGHFFPMSSVWLGVSVEDQKTADERIPLLLQTPAAKRFVSFEPALGPIRFADVPGLNRVVYGPGIDWVIMGCESGKGARPMRLDWARSVRDQCQTAGVPFFFKQAMISGKLAHMPELDGQTWAQFPE